MANIITKNIKYITFWTTCGITDDSLVPIGAPSKEPNRTIGSE